MSKGRFRFSVGDLLLAQTYVASWTLLLVATDFWITFSWIISIFVLPVVWLLAFSLNTKTSIAKHIDFVKHCLIKGASANALYAAGHIFIIEPTRMWLRGHLTDDIALYLIGMFCVGPIYIFITASLGSLIGIFFGGLVHLCSRPGGEDHKEGRNEQQ